METASETLLIIVSATLSVFLILLCVVAIYVIRVVKRINQMVGRAQHMASSVENAAEAVKDSAGVMPLIRLIAKIVSSTQKKDKKESRKDK